MFHSFPLVFKTSNDLIFGPIKDPQTLYFYVTLESPYSALLSTISPIMRFGGFAETEILGRTQGSVDH